MLCKAAQSRAPAFAYLFWLSRVTSTTAAALVVFVFSSLFYRARKFFVSSGAGFCHTESTGEREVPLLFSFWELVTAHLELMKI